MREVCPSFLHMISSVNQIRDCFLNLQPIHKLPFTRQILRIMGSPRLSKISPDILVYIRICCQKCTHLEKNPQKVGMKLNPIMF